MGEFFENCKFNFLNDVRIIEIFYFILEKLLWLVFEQLVNFICVLSNLYVTFFL